MHRTPFEMKSSAELCHYTKEISFVTKPLPVKMLISEIASHAAGTFVEQKFFEEGWSLDACVGRALENELFTRYQIVCTKTLYSYIDLGLLGIKNIDFPENFAGHLKKHRFIKTSEF